METRSAVVRTVTRKRSLTFVFVSACTSFGRSARNDRTASGSAGRRLGPCGNGSRPGAGGAVLRVCCRRGRLPGKDPRGQQGQRVRGSCLGVNKPHARG